MRALLFLLVLTLPLKLDAQRKHGFALGLDLIKNTNSKEWRAANIKVQDHNPNSSILGMNYGIWAAYYYDNRYSIKGGLTYFYQSARVEPIEETPDNFLLSRQASFRELLVGYNLLRKYGRRLSGWVYVGGAVASPLSTQDRITYGGWESYGSSQQIPIHPTAQLMLKYSPVRFVFIGIGGSYRYIFKDFQPFSGNLSIGLQL